MTDTTYEIEICNPHQQVLADGPEYRNILRVFLDVDGECYIEAYSKHSSENGAPVSIWDKRDLIWEQVASQGASHVVDLSALVKLREEIAPLIKTVADGHSTEWNGSNYVGCLTEEASDASDEIETLVSRCQWADDSITVWDAYDWIYDNKKQTIADLKLTASSTPVECAVAAIQLDKDAKQDGVILADTRECIDALVEELKEAAEAEKED
jgi:hypothetical protein